MEMSNFESTTELASPEGREPLVISSQRLLAFDENMTPVMVNQNIDKVSREIVDKVNFSAALLPYKGQRIPDPNQDPEELKEGKPVRYIYDIEPEYEGLTNLEVSAIKLANAAANGDQAAYKMLLDRVAGTPVGKSMNISTNVSYQDFLERLSGQETTSTEDLHDLL